MLRPLAASTGPGIGVTSNFGGGAVNRGVIRGQGLRAWETAGNGPKGTIVGCHGKATWEFQEMGDSFYDATGQGNGRLYVSPLETACHPCSSRELKQASSSHSGLVPEQAQKEGELPSLP